MALGLLLLPAVGGYWFLSHWNYTRFRAKRESGYHLLFNSALYGIPLYVLARLATFVLDLLCPPLTALWDVHVPQPFTSEVMLSLALGCLAPFFLNIFWKSDDCARRTAREVGDQIELLIEDSMRLGRLIELSLRNRKAYVGYALESGIGRAAGTDIILLPMLSGYRHEDTLELIVTTNYVPIMEQFPALYLDFNFVIPAGEITSARFFDLDVYLAFQGLPEQG